MGTISEIYSCLQGEGSRVGVPSILIRTLGCNLRCVWCDTPYTSWKLEKSNLYSNDIIPVLESNPQIDEVIISGGEPTICPELGMLIDICTDRGKKITLETNGTRLIDEDLMKKIDLVSLSPKLSNSTPADPAVARRHNTERIQTTVLRQWMELAHSYQLKFVASTPQDLDEIHTLIDQLKPDRRNIYLMPEGRTQEELQQKRLWLADCCIRDGFCYAERLHIVIYGDKRGV